MMFVIVFMLIGVVGFLLLWGGMVLFVGETIVRFMGGTVMMTLGVVGIVLCTLAMYGLAMSKTVL